MQTSELKGINHMRVMANAAVLVAAITAQPGFAEGDVAILVPPVLGHEWRTQVATTLSRMVVDQGGNPVVLHLNEGSMSEYMENISRAASDGSTHLLVPAVDPKSLLSATHALGIAGAGSDGNQLFGMQLGYGWQDTGQGKAPIVVVRPGQSVSIEAARIAVLPLDGNTHPMQDVISDYTDWLNGSDPGRALALGSTVIPNDWAGEIKVVPEPGRNDNNDDGCGCESAFSNMLSCQPDGYSMGFGDFGFTSSGRLKLDSGDDGDDCGGGCEMRTFALDDYLNGAGQNFGSSLTDADIADFEQRLVKLGFDNQVITVMTCGIDR